MLPALCASRTPTFDGRSQEILLCENEIPIRFPLGWGKDFFDSQSMIDPIFNGKNIVPVNNSNYAQLADPELNAKMDKAEQLTDAKERATAWADINGDEVTIHNVRNCDYRTATDFTPHWETRTVRLSQITGIDLAINYWGSPWIAHPIVSFQFSDGLPLCFSIETRKTIGQQYSTLAGLYRQYTLIYVVADERDVIRLRTNYRREDVYLYHTLASPEQGRQRFREYISTLNALHESPRWYNAVTSNCTTSIRAQRAAKLRTPWDWRILFNGKADEMLYQDHAVATGGLSFTELKQRSLINDRARGADQDPDFSRIMREGLPRSD